MGNKSIISIFAKVTKGEEGNKTKGHFGHF